MIHSARNESRSFNSTTAEHDICYLYLSVLYFQLVDSIIPYVVNSTLNVLLSIVATVANVLVFSAVRRSTSIRFPSKLLLLSLILTDLGVGLLVQPQFVIFIIAKVYGAHKVSCFCLHWYGFAGDMLTSVSLLTMTAICIDRYIAFAFHLRYQEIVTSRRIVAVLVLIWPLPVFFGTSLYWNKIFHTCIAFSGFTVCLLVISIMYVKIYRGLRNQYDRQVRDQASHGSAQQEIMNTLNVAKYRRSVSSMLWVYGLFIFCFTPYICVRIFIAFYRYDVVIRCVYEFTSTFVFLNSCLNPFVYFFRLPEIRAKAQQTLRKVCG